MAWKVDTRLAILVKTDARNFSQLILNTFLQNNYLVNDNLPVVRVQTVAVSGVPQDFEEILNHTRKEVNHRDGKILSEEDWEKHVERIKNLGVLASQASEYETKKNLTEGKTGIVQPDLISSKNIEESLLHAVTSPDTPKKKLLSLEKTDEKIKGLKVEYKRQELLKSPLNPTASFPNLPSNGQVQEQKVVTPESPKFPTASPAKSPTPSVKSKASVVVVELQSPKFPTGSPAKVQPIIPNPNPNDKPSIVKMEKKLVKMEPPQPQEVDGKKLIPNVQETSKNFISAEKEKSAPAATKKVESPKPKPLDLSPIPTPEPPQLSQEPAKLQPSKSSNSIRRKNQKLSLAKPPNILVYSDSITTRGNVIKTLGTILQKNTYTVYPLTAQQVLSGIWSDNSSLLVVCGSVNGSDVGQIFLDYFFKGGKVLCLCSDLLRHVLPTYHTAEVSY